MIYFTYIRYIVIINYKCYHLIEYALYLIVVCSMNESITFQAIMTTGNNVSIKVNNDSLTIYS